MHGILFHAQSMDLDFAWIIQILHGIAHAWVTNDISTISNNMHAFEASGVSADETPIASTVNCMHHMVQSSSKCGQVHHVLMSSPSCLPLPYCCLASLQ